MGCGGKAPQDPGKAAAAGIAADLANYPLTYLVNAGATTGEPVTIGGKTYDFTGLGNADTARVVSDKMAQTLLDIQKSNSPDFIRQRIAELQASDPEGFAARKDLFARIMQSADAQPDRPLAQNLQDAITAELNQGGQLDAKGREQVQEGVRGKQLRNGIILGNAATSEEAGAMVQAGDDARNQRQQQGIDFLQSGVSPEDVEYRRMQQAISDVGSFVNGQSPTAQFKSLSSAGTGAVPITAAPANPAAFNPGAASTGMNFANGIYSGQVNWAQSQVNPWVAGLSTLARPANTLNSAGWNPWGSAQPYYGSSVPSGTYYGNTGGGAATTSPWDAGYTGPG